MGGGFKLTQVLGIFGITAAAFAGGIFYLTHTALENQPPAPEVGRVDPGTPPKVVDFKWPSFSGFGSSKPAGKATGQGGKPTAEAVGQWSKKSIYGLPNPRKLTDEEKTALTVVGAAHEIYQFDFNRVTLDDGST